MGYGAVLFDLDGTLIDTQKGIVRSFAHTFRTLGCEVEEQTIRRYLGPPLRESFAQHFSGETVERAVQIYRDYYARHGLEGVAPFEGVPDMLKALRAAGYTVCVATGKARDVALQVLEHFSMTQYFAYIGGASADASLETKAAVIRSVLAQPALAGLCAVMVGDRDNDMQGARACGLDAVGVRYGYAFAGELEAYAPVYLAHSARDLCRWLLDNKEQGRTER